MKINFEGNWFVEGALPSVRDVSKIAIQIGKRIYRGRSKYQEIEVFDSYKFGRILALDKIIQLSEGDEFIYHEMLTHLPMISHPNPKKVLIVGGGDGGVLREALRHPVKEVYLVDIDKKVIEVSKKYLQFVSKGAFNDKRAKIFIEDGIKFVKKYRDFFDVIIIDSTDPAGPSVPLFSKKFYKDCFKALTKEGVISIQTMCFFNYFPIIKRTYKKLTPFFPSVKLYQADIPCFHCGEYCFTLASKKIDLGKIDLNYLKKRFKKIKGKLKYYSPEIHQSSMVLPKIWKF